MPVMALVPLPCRRPVSVVAPVPPSATASCVVSVSDEADTAPEKLAAAAVSVPVSVGDTENTELPHVPVEATSRMNSAQVSISTLVRMLEASETEDSRLAIVMVETRFLLASVATSRDAVNPLKLMVPEEVMPVRPEATPAPVTSQTLESMVTLSPLSPRVTTPLASSVPLAVSVPESVAAAATMVPVSVGEADITTLPVPVMALDTRFLLASVNTACDAVRPEKLTVPGVYKVPETVSAVLDAYWNRLATTPVE